MVQAQSIQDDLPEFIMLFKTKNKIVSDQFRDYMASDEMDTVQLYTDGYQYFPEAGCYIFVVRVNDRIDDLASLVFYQVNNDTSFDMVGSLPLIEEENPKERVLQYGSYSFNDSGFSMCTHLKIIEKGLEYTTDPLQLNNKENYKYPTDYIKYDYYCVEKYFTRAGRLASRNYSDSTYADWDYATLKEQNKESLFFGLQSIYAKHNVRFKEEFLFQYFSIFNWYDPIVEDVESKFTDREKDLLKWLKIRLSD